MVFDFHDLLLSSFDLHDFFGVPSINFLHDLPGNFPNGWVSNLFYAIANFWRILQSRHGHRNSLSPYGNPKNEDPHKDRPRFPLHFTLLTH